MADDLRSAEQTLQQHRWTCYDCSAHDQTGRRKFLCHEEQILIQKLNQARARAQGRMRRR
jgi:hypothetical protein